MEMHPHCYFDTALCSYYGWSASKGCSHKLYCNASIRSCFSYGEIVYCFQMISQCNDQSIWQLAVCSKDLVILNNVAVLFIEKRYNSIE